MKASKTSRKKTKLKDVAKATKVTKPKPTPKPQIVDSDKFFRTLIERRISDAEKELDTIRAGIPANETGKGYMKALEGLLLTAKSNDDKFLYLAKIEKTPTKLRNIRREFAAQTENGLHTDYDRGYFQALEGFIRKLERSDLPTEPNGEKKNAETTRK
jgi:hypothetical protein